MHRTSIPRFIGAGSLNGRLQENKANAQPSMTIFRSKCQRPLYNRIALIWAECWSTFWASRSMMITSKSSGERTVHQRMSNHQGKCYWVHRLVTKAYLNSKLCSDVLTLLTATADDVLQEGVLRGHEAPPSSRHHYLDTVNFRNFGGYTGRPDQQNATMVGVLTKGKIKNKNGVIRKSKSLIAPVALSMIQDSTRKRIEKTLALRKVCGQSRSCNGRKYQHSIMDKV